MSLRHLFLHLFLASAVTDRPNTELNSIRVLPDGRMLASDTKNQRIVMVSRQRCSEQVVGTASKAV
jgi:hypothetical protein